VTSTEPRRIGVLTGGGDCPGVNAVIRAVVKTAINVYGWELVGIEDGFDGLLNSERNRPLTLDSVRGILPRGGTILGTTNRSNPFAYRETPDAAPQDVSVRVVDEIERIGIDALVVIGGDGTLSIAHEFSRMGVQLVGVPKTIDNDLYGTDVTFGFDTAVVTATEALDRLHTTAESHHRIMILEVMGRSAGWIAIRAGIAGGADIICMPEIPFRIDRILDAISARDDAGSKFSIAVVAEGAIPVGGDPMLIAGTGGHGARYEGIGNWLGDQLTSQTDHEVRVTVLGHLQRGGGPSPFDRFLATRFGTHAVRLLASGVSGQMVAYHGTRLESVPLEEAISSTKTVPLDNEYVQTALAMGICLSI
jgi:ATP-dependent phosphofructokinase / diphosphate-dependent phosphofructokinase